MSYETQNSKQDSTDTSIMYSTLNFSKVHCKMSARQIFEIKPKLSQDLKFVEIGDFEKKLFLETRLKLVIRIKKIR